MATASFAGTNYALKATPRVGTWPVAAECNSARVYCMSDECYSTSTATAGSKLYLGGLPAGAVVLMSVIWPVDSDNVAGGGDGTAAATTASLGTLAITGPNARVADPDLFGDVTTLATATPQVIEPCPDGTIYTTTLDFALREAVTPILLTVANDIVATEGVALKILYTMGGREH